MVQLRAAQLSDLEQIRAIYNDAILTTTATSDTELKSQEDRVRWFSERDENFPVWVAVENNLVLGYVALSKWSERKAYSITAEVSLYVEATNRGKGIGELLLAAIVKRAIESTNLHSIIARISEGNEQSIHLHELNGFKLMGVMKEAGSKFGKLHSVSFMQKMLRE